MSRRTESTGPAVAANGGAGVASDSAGGGLREAAWLARRGRYAEAVVALQRALEAGACTETEALDFRARVSCQQGQHLDAESCWRRAAELDPGNPAYRAGLERLRRLRLGPGRWRLAASLAAWAAVAGLLWWRFAVIGTEIQDQSVAMDERFTGLHADLQAELQKELRRVDEGVRGSLARLATREETRAQRDEVLAAVERQAAHVGKAVDGGFEALGAQRAAAEAAAGHRTEGLASALHDWGAALEYAGATQAEGVLHGLSERLEAFEQERILADARAAEGLAGIQASLGQGADRSAQARAELLACIVELDRSLERRLASSASTADLEELRTRMAELQAVVKQLLAAQAATKASSPELPSVPGNQPPVDGAPLPPDRSSSSSVQWWPLKSITKTRSKELR